jgi:hypothetical protein
MSDRFHDFPDVFTQGNSVPLPGSDLLLRSWRASSFDLPLACTVAADTLAIHYWHSLEAHIERRQSCGSVPELIAEELRFTEDTVRATAQQARRLADEVSHILEQTRL